MARIEHGAGATSRLGLRMDVDPNDLKGFRQGAPATSVVWTTGEDMGHREAPAKAAQPTGRSRMHGPQRAPGDRQATHG